jgi:selenocysteine lyase/cysteine desulfurase
VYLDTARLGRISPGALAIQTDYLRFSAKYGSSSALQHLLLRGGAEWAPQLRQAFPALSSWQGVEALQKRICRVAGADKKSRVMLAGRSQSLMELASYLLLRNSEVVVTVDLAWPPYLATVRQVAEKIGREVIEVPLRDGIHRGDDEQAIIAKIVAAFRNAPSASLLLPAISHDGVRLPVGEIAAAMRAVGELRFVVVDGAQHLAHGDTPVSEMECDFYLAGTHKWLRSLAPLGVGIYGHARSRDIIENTVVELSKAGLFADPLLRFTTQLQSLRLDDVSETCNVSALFSAHGAAGTAHSSEYRPESLAVQLKNVDEVSLLAKECDWRVMRPSHRLRSGIIILRPPKRSIWDCERLRQHLDQHQVIATTYDDLAVRLSMPRRPLARLELDVIRKLFTECCVAGPIRRPTTWPAKWKDDSHHCATQFSTCRN